jgi:hypothetical protein
VAVAADAVVTVVAADAAEIAETEAIAATAGKQSTLQVARRRASASR